MKNGMRETAVALAAILIAAVLAAAGYLSFAGTLRARPTPANYPNSEDRLARGRRIYHLAGCDDCHARRDFSRFGAPVAAGSSGSGGLVPGRPGQLAPSLRSVHLGAWNDAEIARAIRDGVGRDGRLLSPSMPSSSFHSLTESDLQSLVVYLRRMPSRLEPPSEDPVAGPLPDGAYLSAIARCSECHTRPGGAAFAGGREFRLRGARVLSANLTPDCYSGIGRWSQAEFVERFHQYRDYVDKGSPTVGPGGVTVMPWLRLAQLPATDLAAIYRHIRSTASRE
jgi:mono/diheme cytochrome c family protein